MNESEPDVPPGTGWSAVPGDPTGAPGELVASDVSGEPTRPLALTLAGDEPPGRQVAAPVYDGGQEPATPGWMVEPEPEMGRDWAWVEEWRESGEPPAWAPGIALATFTAVLVGLAVLVLSTGLGDMPWLAVAANVLVAAGLAPALWLSRHLPVLRWISIGAAAGVVLGWIAALIG